MSLISSQAFDFLNKNQKKKIVFTNGCFDLIHIGHIAYLNEAKALGDLLFVGLNSDSSVKKLKGERRPINSEKDRKYLLENIKSVDFVEIFNDETPLELIKEVKPDILVKGGDWSTKDIIGSELVLSYGGIVKSLILKRGYSTTSLIKKIQL